MAGRERGGGGGNYMEIKLSFSLGMCGGSDYVLTATLMRSKRLAREKLISRHVMYTATQSADCFLGNDTSARIYHAHTHTHFRCCNDAVRLLGSSLQFMHIQRLSEPLRAIARARARLHVEQVHAGAKLPCARMAHVYTIGQPTQREFSTRGDK